jgi:Putative undecaprenyl diphosphate synthase
MSSRRSGSEGGARFVVALALDRPLKESQEHLRLARTAVWFFANGARHVSVVNAASVEPAAWQGAGLSSLTAQLSFQSDAGPIGHFAGDGFGLTLLPPGCGRAAIVAAVRALKQEGGELRSAVECVAGPEADLVLTFANRLSLDNAFIWQAAYAEFVHLPMTWTDATEEDFSRAVQEFAARNRRFGNVAMQTAP